MTTFILLPMVVKANSKAQDVLSLGLLPKIDELYAKLEGSKVYSYVYCSSDYHHIALSDAAQKVSAFVILIGKFEFKGAPFGLA